MLSAGCVAGVLPPLVPLPVPGLATCGMLDPPLHAASASAAAAARTASAPGRRCILVISQRLPCTKAPLPALHGLPGYLSLLCLPIEAMVGTVVQSGRS